MNTDGVKSRHIVDDSEADIGQQQDNGIEQCSAAEFFGFDSNPRAQGTGQTQQDRDILQAFSQLNDSSRLREQFLDCIKSLMIRQRGRNRFPDRNSILTILNMMQNNRELVSGREEDRGALGAEQLEQPLADFTRILVAASSGSVNQSQLEAVNSIRTTFRKLLADERLGARARVLISDLQIPYLKINFIERGFLKKADHPATQVLKKMMLASFRFSSKTFFDNDPVYKECVRVHARIMDEFENRMEVFDDILRSSRLFGDSGTSGQGVVADSHNLLALEEGSPVSRLISMKLDKRRISEDIEGFIRGPWAAVMVRIREQYGERHRLWAQSISVIDRLIWLTQPRSGSRQKADLQARFPGLLLDIEEGMKLISYSRPYKEGLVAKLMQIYADQLSA